MPKRILTPSVSLEIAGDFSAVARAQSPPGDQVDVVGHRAHRAIAQTDIDDTGVEAGWRDLHGHVGHVAREAHTRARFRVRWRDMVISRATHFAHDPAGAFY